ncbi:MAG TPA: copper chaperone [Thiotrichales bacterium]|nr:copper chaperone [Thiotrichales bacterium]
MRHGMQETFEVQNVKCGGCVKAIEEGLATLPGVQSVKATTAGEVTVEGNALDRQTIEAKLAELGYPVRT